MPASLAPAFLSKQSVCCVKSLLHCSRPTASHGCSMHRRQLTACPTAGSKYKAVGALLPLVATVALVMAGSALTGPSMNPAHAFSWNYFLQVLAALSCPQLTNSPVCAKPVLREVFVRDIPVSTSP